MPLPLSRAEPMHDRFNTKIRDGSMTVAKTPPKSLHTTASLNNLRDDDSCTDYGSVKSPKKAARANTAAFDPQPLFTSSLTRSPTQPDAPIAHKTDPKRRNTFAIRAREALNLSRNTPPFAMTLPSAASSNVLSDTETTTIVEISHEDPNTATSPPPTHTNPGEIVSFWRKIARRWSEGDAQKKPVLRTGILRIASMVKEKEAKQEAERKRKREKGDKKQRAKKKKSDWGKLDRGERDDERDDESEHDGKDEEDGEGRLGKQDKGSEWEGGMLSTSRSTTIKMTASEIVSALVLRGCKDLSKSIKEKSFSAAPVACGGLSDIYRGRLNDGTLVAVKAWRILAQQTMVESAQQLRHAASELHTWSKCDHPNVLRLLGLAMFRDRIGMVSSWMSKGTLPQYMKSEPSVNVNRHDLCVRICAGLTYLHKTGIVHGDLKGANILIADDGTPVLADFGSSTMKDQTLKFAQLKDNRALTVRWSAPELLHGKDAGRHTKQSDIYALGMTLYEVISGDIPYHRVGMEVRIMFFAIKGILPTRPVCTPTDHESSKKVWELFTHCWRFRAEERPSAAEVGEIMKAIPLEGAKYRIPEQPEEIDGPLDITERYREEEKNNEFSLPRVLAIQQAEPQDPPL